MAYKAILGEAKRNKHGITVTEHLDFGIVSPGDSQQGVQLEVRVENAVPLSRIRLLEARLSSACLTNVSSSCVFIYHLLVRVY